MNVPEAELQSMARWAYYGIIDETMAGLMADFEEDMDNVTLTTTEYQQLQAHEAVIERGLGTFIEVGNSLLAIRDGRLYREEYPTFEEYCRDRWGMTRQHANRLVSAAETVKVLEPMGSILPTTERQIRSLTGMDTDQQRQAWQEAVETAPNGRPTSAHVERVAGKYRQPATEETPADNRPLYGKDENLDEALADQVASVFTCACGQVFDFEVWHCRGCGRHHRLSVVQCPTCSASAAPAMSQELQVLLSHESTEWYTPPEYVDAAREVMGRIDLDPATAALPQSWIKATVIYTLQDDGLVQEWLGRVWLNAPYSKTDGQSNQELWALKLIQEYEAGRVSEAIMLVKASFGYNWFDRLFDCYPVCLHRGLISFIKPDGHPGGPAKLGSAFYYLGPNLARFAAAFNRFGRVIAPEDCR